MRLHTLIEGKPRAFEVTARFDRTYDAVVVGLGSAGATAPVSYTHLAGGNYAPDRGELP